MSEMYAHVSVRILEKEYQVACPADERTICWTPPKYSMQRCVKSATAAKSLASTGLQ